MQDIWLEMKSEYEQNTGPGKLWLAEIGRIAQQVVNKKVQEHLPPSVFGFTNWDKDDLVQLVLMDRLLGRNQIRYVLDTADTIDEARKILRNEINFVLADHRVPNQVDNLWGNLEPRLIELGWQSGPMGKDNESGIHDQVVRLILSQKRLRNRGSQRFSPLFAGPVLALLAKEIFELTPKAPSSLLIKALRTALTIISPAMSIEDVHSFEVGPEGTEKGSEASKFSFKNSEESLRMERAQYGTRWFEIAIAITEKLDHEVLEIIFQESNGANQTEIGEVLGVTRQTARYRIEEARQLLLYEFSLLGLDIEESRDVLSALLSILGASRSEMSR
jgi:DNA-directed RNA polymerase specialized sigma24 family protein